MKRLLIIAGALLLLNAVAHAELGESPKQFESRPPDSSTRNGDGFVLIWNGPQLSHSGFFLGGKAVVETFWFNDRHPMTSKEVERFLRPYANYSRTPVVKAANESVHAFNLYGRNSQFYAVVVYDKNDHSLCILRKEVWDSLYEQPQQREQSFDEKPVAIQTPPPAPQDENACMVVASVHYHDLKDKSAWANIVRFQVYVNGKREWGHAMTVWKITGDGKIQVNDADGTFELNTTSTALEDVTNALSMAITKILHAKGVQGDITLEQATFGIAQK